MTNEIQLTKEKVNDLITTKESFDFSFDIKAYNGDKISITESIIDQFLCPGASSKEKYEFVLLCRSLNLNPIEKDVYMIPYEVTDKKSGKTKTAYRMVVSIGAMRKRASEHQDYDGIDKGTTGEGQNLIGWAKVYRKNISRPYCVEVHYKEYAATYGLWKTKPRTMIEKVAEFHAYRGAFPHGVNQFYCEEEFDKKEKNDFHDIKKVTPELTGKAEVSNQERLDTLSGGKYKGNSISDIVDVDYLLQISKHEETPDRIKEHATIQLGILGVPKVVNISEEKQQFSPF
jgi:phage recombination protein Bet